MKQTRALSLRLAPLMLVLGGCTVTSEAPLFGPGDAAARPLSQGIWALHGPGCDVTPGQPTPDCAWTIEVDGDRIEADPSKLVGAMGGAGPPAGSPGSAMGPNAFLLAEGDPEVLQLHAPSGQGTPDAAGPWEYRGRYSYLAFRPLHRNATGGADRGIVWPVLCPKSGVETPGLKPMTPAGCQASNPEAVRGLARRIPPVFSFFMTWVGPVVKTPHPAG